MDTQTIQPITFFNPPASQAEAIDITPNVPLFAIRDTVVINNLIGLSEYQSGLQFNSTTTQAGSGNSILMIDPMRGLWVGAAEFANAPFSVDMAGAATFSNITITGGTVNSSVLTGVIAPANGGTGVANNAGMTVTGSGSFAYTRTLTGVTNVTFPTSGTLATRAGTETLTNKRRTLRTVTVTQSATPAINTDNADVAYITGLAQAITSMTTNLSGTPIANDQLIISITDDGTARAITWGASFEASTVALPTTTVISTRLDVGFLYNTATTKWRCVAVA